METISVTKEKDAAFGGLTTIPPGIFYNSVDLMNSRTRGPKWKILCQIITSLVGFFSSGFHLNGYRPKSDYL